MGRLRVVLEDVRISSPCSQSWEDMTGTDRVRHCAKCDLDVYDFSSMSREEAEALLAERLGSGTRLCGGGIRRADGSFISGDCPAGELAERSRFLAAAAIGASMVLAIFVIAVGAFYQMRRVTCAEGAGLGSAEDVITRSPTLNGIQRMANGQSFTPPPRKYYGMVIEN